MPASKIFYSQIEQATCRHFRIVRAELQCRARDRAHFIPRAILVALARHHTRLSFPQIGAKLHRDHTTILSTDRRARELLAASEDFRADFVAVEKLLSEAPAAPEPAPDTPTREEAIAKAWRASLPNIPYTMESSL